MKKSITTVQTEENILETLRLLSEMPAHLEKLSGGLSEEKLLAPLGKGERSFIETLAHLLNSEARSTDAITLALLAKEPLQISIHPQRDLGKLLQFEKFPFVELLMYFKFRRKVLMNILTVLKDSQWSRVIRQKGKQRQESVYWQARSLALHEFEHIQDLKKKLQKKAGS